ncbi:hypothetical protein AEAC466_07240 [Asticcacaulis sp. AC466]|uniref:DUF6445 family protein n=1 Tax=Asticcacaulis sp. AC466 TaxID=1282362 RepID=UPI0003C3D5CA|nr:DUF6445 family protein [Asticcacaulis sp. AC466]ESQ84845.1 hypothetical protein AEAC466_07240 [Asticcacaulis sp. AC466]
MCRHNSAKKNQADIAGLRYHDDMSGEEISIQLNPQARVRLTHIGAEQNPLIVIDDVLLNPDDLIEAAARTPFAAPEATYYPGVNAAIPTAYLQALVPILRPTLMRAFGIGKGQMSARAFFALSTRRADELVPLQKIPHYDQPDPRGLAMVHYLARDQAGGTGFFRHDTTGYESIPPERREGYMTIVAQELEAATQLNGYTGADTPNYTLLEAVEPRFNRLILYRSNLLHCALFDGARLSDDPRTGRLTANSFFFCD